MYLFLTLAVLGFSIWFLSVVGTFGVCKWDIECGGCKRGLVGEALAATHLAKEHHERIFPDGFHQGLIRIADRQKFDETK